MPAHRSRTHRWRDSLAQIRDRGAGLEFTLASEDDHDRAGDLVWRVRLYEFDDDTMLVEHPGALGHAFPIERGRDLIGVISVGQNRWMFRSRVIEVVRDAGAHPCLRVAMPRGVERCSRRSADRTSLGAIEHPRVDVWPLLDIAGARPIEIASRALIQSRLEHPGGEHADEPMLPEVGAHAPAHLSNIGGGGVGLIIDAEHRSVMDHHAHFWIGIDLRPVVPAPLSMVAKRAHTHADSQGRLCAGMAFDFGRAPEHRAFVLAQIDRFLRHAQPQRRAA